MKAGLSGALINLYRFCSHLARDIKPLNYSDNPDLFIFYSISPAREVSPYRAAGRQASIPRFAAPPPSPAGVRPMALAQP
jgi:hypothetical protein